MLTNIFWTEPNYLGLVIIITNALLTNAKELKCELQHKQ